MQDYKSCMLSEVNIDDVLTVGWFKSWLGMKISNKAETIKRCGNFEVHDQFITECGFQLLVNAFENYLQRHPGVISVEDSSAAQKLVLDFLSESGIKFFLDLNNTEETETDKFDDLLSYSKDLCTRTVLSTVCDKMEEEEDALGLRGLKMALIPYFLNRKANIQDSKYAQYLLLDLVIEKSASQRTQRRMDCLACVNPPGEAGRGLFRDKRNEHEIRDAKASLRSTHANLKAHIVEKTVVGLSTVNKIAKHDRASMLAASSSSHTSYDYIGEKRREMMKKEVSKVNPFSRNREKIELFEKGKASPFSGMTEEKLTIFVDRNRKTFVRNYPEKKL